MQKPSLGLTVIVPMNSDTNNGADEAPAVVTRVWSDTMVNLTVLPDHGQVGAAVRRTSVQLHEDKDSALAAGNKFGVDAHVPWVAWWPPRV